MNERTGAIEKAKQTAKVIEETRAFGRPVDEGDKKKSILQEWADKLLKNIQIKYPDDKGGGDKKTFSE